MTCTNIVVVCIYVTDGLNAGHEDMEVVHVAHPVLTTETKTVLSIREVIQSDLFSVCVTPDRIKDIVVSRVALSTHSSGCRHTLYFLPLHVTRQYKDLKRRMEVK